MKHNFKRFLSLVVAMVMVFGMLPMNVFATEGEPAAAVAEVNGVQYASLDKAVKAADKVETTIKLLVSELTERVIIGYSTVQNITIDLNGAKLSSNDVTLNTMRNGTTLTLVNGTIYGNSKAGGSVCASTGCKLVLGEGMVINCGPHATGVTVKDGTLVINSDVQITSANNWLTTNASAKNTVIISAGTFTGGMSVGEGTKMQLSGGYYTVRPEDSWCVEGYEVKRNGTDMWTVGPVDDTITVDGVWFKDWEAAESAVTTNSVIKLFANQTNSKGSSAFVRKGTVTLDLNGYTLSSPFEKTATNSLPVEHTNLYVIDSFGGGKLIGNDSHSLFAYINGNVYFEDGVQFIGSLQSTRGKGTFYVDGVELLGANGIFQTSDTARIKMHENGDWTISIGTLTMTDDFALADNTLTISDGNVVIDLNGNKLTAKEIKVKKHKNGNSGSLIDSTNGDGAVYTEKLTFEGQNNNYYLPLYDAENGCYRLYAAEIEITKSEAVSATTVKFNSKIYFNKVKAYELLAANPEDVDVHMTVECFGSNTEGFETDIKDAKVKEFAEWAAKLLEETGKVGVSMRLNGDEYDKHEAGDEFKVTPAIRSEMGVVITGKVFTHVK